MKGRPARRRQPPTQLAQLAQQTATTSLRRHVNAGRLDFTSAPEIVKVQYADGQILKLSTAARYTVSTATYASELGEITGLGKGSTTDLPPASPTRDYHGVFEQSTRKGLGRTARSIFEALAQPLTQSQLHTTTGHCARTIKNALALLISNGLVSRFTDKPEPEGQSFMGCMAKSCTLTNHVDTRTVSRRGRIEGRIAGSGWLYVASQDVDFHELGRKLGTLAVGAVRKSQHERETIRYQERLQGLT